MLRGYNRSVLHDTIDILKRAELFKGLDDDVLRLLARHSNEKRLNRDEILFTSGDTAHSLYVIAEGAVRAFRSTPDGREQIIHVERAVTTLAEVAVFDDGTYPSTVAAEEPSVLYSIGKADMRSACLQYPALALAAARLMAKRLRKCAELVESLSLKEVGQRIAQLFLEQSSVNGKQNGRTVTFPLMLTYTQLAARIGTVREVVSRTIARLQSVGLVEIEGKRITLTDVEALRAYAGGQ